jgi:hypothetical protein
LTWLVAFQRLLIVEPFMLATTVQDVVGVVPLFVTVTVPP